MCCSAGTAGRGPGGQRGRGRRTRRFVEGAATHIALSLRVALQVAEARARHGHPGFVYQVDWRSALGACHTVDIPLLFDNLPAWSASPMFHDVDPAGVEPIGRAFRQAVAAFVRTGNPNTPGAPAWEAYTELRRCTMRFDTFVTAANDPAYSERRLLLPSRRHSSGSAETGNDDS
ncbi:carboxylesterase family protein [Streptosporangium canum]|uniref:carboxylesterase family protein n=1 Tax=Streptosporangium canum TaxID=324952 RepID=UPI003445C97A